MKSIRLNYHVRSKIIEFAKKDLFGDLEDERDAERDAIKDVLLARIYNNQIPEENVALWSRAIHVAVRDGQELPAITNFYLDLGHRNHINPAPITDEALYTRIESWNAKSNDLYTKTQDITGRIRVLLDACTTTKQVIEAWPDGEKYVRQLQINDAQEERVLDERRKHAARIAEVFLEHGIDVVTPIVVESEVANEAQTI